MNWLIYLGGWLLGAFIFGHLSSHDGTRKTVTILISWTMTWIWVCWKFV